MRRSHIGFAQALVPLLIVSAACGAAQQQRGGSAVVMTGGDAALGSTLADCSIQQVEGNGLAQNGLVGNGICQNGLGAAGLDLGRLGTQDFADWFNADPAKADMIMRYAYRCAADEDASLTWTNPATGTTYTWVGGLGLATSWVSGNPATMAEQQVVSACLAALVNKYGRTVRLAIEGRTATGREIPIDHGELATYPVREGCFFGNLFTNEGVFVGSDHEPWGPAVSSVRACALDQPVGVSVECPPEYYVGSCQDLCEPDQTGTFYERCTFNGVSYRPLVTRLEPADVYTCGDGVCQFTEHCGDGDTAQSCLADCGPCP